jgi:hypothetical protein
VTAQERDDIVASSPLGSTYGYTLDRESAFEQLRRREAELGSLRQQGTDWSGGEARRGTGRRKGHSRQTTSESLARSLVRSFGSSLGRSIVRGILGSITGRR